MKQEVFPPGTGVGNKEINKTLPKWPVWLVAGLALINGIAGILQALFSRFHHYPRPFVDLLPFGLEYWNRSLTLIFGVLLVYLSFELLNQRRTAFLLSVAATGVLSALSLFHLHFWYLFLPHILTLVLLLVSRDLFFVRSEINSIRNGLFLMLGSFATALVYGCLGFWVLGRTELHQPFNLGEALVRSMRQFILLGNSDLTHLTRNGHWFLNSLSIIGPLAFILAVYSLFRPIAYHLRTLPKEQNEARAILQKYGKGSYDYFKVWPDKSYYFSDDRNSFISYKTVQGVALCLGDPVGPQEQLAAIVASFLDYCKHNAWIAAFMMPDEIGLYENEGLSVIKIGQEASVDLQKFAETISKTKYFRYISRTLEGQGFHVEKALPPHPGKLVDHVEIVSNAWLGLPRHREFGFFQGKFSRQYIEDSPLFVIYDKNKEVKAWINQVPSYSPGEATFDMMRHQPGTHWATMDYLFMTMMLKLKDEGFKTLNMGVAPFSKIGTTAGASISDKALHRLTDVLDWFVHSEGISNYKEKFKPDWFPRYVAYQGGPINLSKLAIASLSAL